MKGSVSLDGGLGFPWPKAPTPAIVTPPWPFPASVGLPLELPTDPVHALREGSAWRPSWPFGHGEPT
jgi:hypothetical protein